MDQTDILVIVLYFIASGLFIGLLFAIRSRKYWMKRYEMSNREFWDLKGELVDCKHEKRLLELKIKEDYPILHDPTLDPVVSVLCKECKYVIKSNWDGGALKCCKNVVCVNFEREETNK